MNPKAVISLTAGSATETVCEGTSITARTYELEGSATSYTISTLPAGLSHSFNTSTNVITVSGTPTISGTGTYTITTTGHTAPCTAATATGSVTMNSEAVISLTAGSATEAVCEGTAITARTYELKGGATSYTITTLPAGLSHSFNTSTNVITVSGVPTASGSGTYTITTTGHTAPCIAATVTDTVPVNLLPVISLTAGSATEAVCEGTAITTRTYELKGGATSYTITTLPAGLSHSFNTSTNVITISGVPTISGTGTYTITTTGHTAPCIAATASGSVTMNHEAVISLTAGSATETVCEGTAITARTYELKGGATSYTISTLPAGLSHSFNTSTNVITVSGTPTISGTGTYTITTTGHTAPCIAATATGSVTMNSKAVISLTAGSATETVCEGTAITARTYELKGGATSYTISTLPAGLSHRFNTSTNVITVSGVPTISGTGTYTITTTGHTAPCTAVTASGSVTRNPKAVISLTAGSATETVCEGTAITARTYELKGGATSYTISTLPAGLSHSFNTSTNVITVSGVPTISGTGTYTITTTGHTAPCTAVTASGSVTMNPKAVINLTAGSATQTVCVGAAITTRTYELKGGATSYTISTLPAGLSHSFNTSTNVITVSGTPTGGGTYTITTTGQVSPCTAATITSSVTRQALPTAPTITQGGSTCTKIEFTASGYSGTLQWNNTGGGTVSGNKVTIANAATNTSVTARSYLTSGGATCFSAMITKTVSINFSSPNNSYWDTDFCPNPNISTGSTWTIHDTRDNKTYKIKKMADGRFWMVQDLRYGPCTGDSFRGSEVATDFFGPNTFGLCQDGMKPDEGYLYNWPAAMQNADAAYGSTYTGCSGSTTYPSGTEHPCKGLCPYGFHVPTYDELIDANTKFQSVYGCSDDGCWNPSSQWEGFMGGYTSGSTSAKYFYRGNRAFYWSSSQYDKYCAYGLRFDYGSLGSWHNHFKVQGYSLRCVFNY
jgi:uncharacterized protein (TIGR02145 family)